MFSKILTSRLGVILGEDFESSMNAFSLSRKGSFRLNTLKTNGEDVFAEFAQKGIEVEEFEIGSLKTFFFDRQYEYAIKGTRAFYDGKIYLQSIASMLPVLALEPGKGDRILDVCAAPGSKTTQMAMMMNNEGNIVALEQNQIRYDKLMHNCRLQGASIVRGMKMDAKKFLETPLKKGENAKHQGDWIPFWDKILLDAPCSAEGRINLLNEKSYGFWSIANIRTKAELQYELLSLSWEHLEIGGSLVYSTCTLAPEENEGVISRFLTEHSDAELQDIDIGLSLQSWWKTSEQINWQDERFADSDLFANEWMKYIQHQESRIQHHAIRILPSEETEGFFMVKITKCA